MNLTGECKKAFENWYMNIYHKKFTLNHLELIQATHLNRLGVFNCMPENMQYGVLVDFFDSVGVKVIDDYDINLKEYFVWIMEDFKDARTLLGLDNDTQYYKTRNEARTAAITKANELYNEQSKNKKTITKQN